MCPKKFLELLKDNKINFYTGVPDSLLKNFLTYVEAMVNNLNHIITANEGSAIGLSIGYHLSTGKVPLVYLQNSGLGNCINPLVSLADPKVYSIPMILLIGWRGEKNIPDEPQHKKQGIITISTLKILNIPYIELKNGVKEPYCKRIINLAKKNNFPIAMVVRKNFFQSGAVSLKNTNSFPCSREDAIKILLSHLKKSDIIVSTTGMTSRELDEIRGKTKNKSNADFLTVGGMGHASQIALGIAITNKQRRIVCIDGDGAAIMHMGGMTSIGSKKLRNYKHILINNGVHGSVGGQKTTGFDIDFKKIALGCGYDFAKSCYKKNDISKKIKEFLNVKKSSFLEIQS